MTLRSALAGAAFVGALALPAAANAYQACVSADVNLRTGPGTYYDIIYAIPYGTTIEVYGCDGGWCQASWQGYQGYLAARYVTDYCGPRRYDPPPRRYTPRYTPRY